MKTKISPENLSHILLILLLIICVSLGYAVFDPTHYEKIDVATFLYLFGKFAGVISFLFLSILIFSGDTARFFDKFLGIDRIIKFQRKFSLVTLFFVLTHPIFFMISSGSILPLIIPDFSMLPLSMGILSLYIYILIIIASTLYKRISYTAWQYLHVLTYILFGFAMYHAYFIGSDSHHFAIRALYSTSLVMIVSGIIYRTQYKIRKIFAPKFLVKEIIKETKDSFTLVLKSDKIFNFDAGQFCFLQLRKDKLYARHPFTISSAPNKNELRFTIKITGKFTKALSELKSDEEVLVDGPFGVFTVKDNSKNLVFVAGGVGITPFVSILEDQIQKGNKQNTTLLYASKTTDEIILKSQIDSINTNWFKKIFFVSNQENINNPEIQSGRINIDTITKYVNDIKNSIFYICGPESMKNNIKIGLRNLGVKNNQIIVEDFFW